MLDRLATLDAFAATIGKPAHTYAWGSSMGGLAPIALMEQAPGRFEGALVICASAAFAGPVPSRRSRWRQHPATFAAFRN